MPTGCPGCYRHPDRGGIELPDGTVIHVFAPGPPDITLPFTGIQLMGRDVEPSVLTDYKGFTALAFHVGTATGSDGRQYNLETDMRAMEGTYIAEGRADTDRGFAQLGPERNGTFCPRPAAIPCRLGDVLTPQPRRGTKRRMSVSTGS
jgi:hypothetical protein